MLFSRTLATLLLLLSTQCQASGTHDWEWAGVFNLEAANYTWSFSRKSTGLYAENTIKLLAIPTDDGDSHGIEEVEALAEARWDKNTTVGITRGETMMLNSTTAYTVTMDQFSYSTPVHIEVATEGYYAFFLEHLVSEFESSNVHYLKEANGHDIKPSATEPATVTTTSSGSGLSKEKATQLAILATFVTCLPTLAVIFTVWFVINIESSWFRALGAFGAGVLISAVFFHIYPEGIIMANDKSWKTGLTVFSGILTSFLLDGLVSMFGMQPQQASSSTRSGSNDISDAKSIELQESGTSASASAQSKLASSTTSAAIQGVIIQENTKVTSNVNVGLLDFSNVQSVCWSLLFGDMFHNVVDGVIIGAAFKSCSVSLGWKIVGIVVAHEMPQEVGDFFILLNKGMSVKQAIGLNFLTSLSALCGAIAVVSTDITDRAQGYMLLYATGLFLYSTLTGVLPELTKSKNFSGILTAFCLGAVTIGLAMLQGDEHCVASTSGADAHAGHNH